MSRSSSTHSTSSNSAGPEKKAEPVSAPPLTFPLTFPTTGFQLIDPAEKVEEEKDPTYDPKERYPARLGQIIPHGKNQYQIIAKLGYGSSSTVWLCYNLWKKEYKALKIHINTLPVIRELEIFEHLRNTLAQDTQREVTDLMRAHLRQIDDHFTIPRPQPGTTHHVFVFEPLGFSLLQYQKTKPDLILPQNVVQMALVKALLGLIYLHAVANVTHTDFHSGNLHFEIIDRSIFAEAAISETKSNPSPRKVTEDGVVYTSRDIMSGAGEIILCDFGLARIGDAHQGTAMPLRYRSPEVNLGMIWGHAVDVWSYALTAWDLMQPTSLFKNHDELGMELYTAHHLAEMVALMGPPPREFLSKSKACEKFWDKDGTWKHATVKVPTERTMESLQKALKGNDAVVFMNFIRKVLCWLPQQRPSVLELLEDPWVKGGI
ncbi:kinase-like protein [Lasiosphaeria miniovina]|uniref:Kinase-like protein n=1 Tax=Lasiosphaeria miniovina TaxID=1954250 RepID=A0AA40DUM2_9PEZI|nr:kinase-like protein [Lasiosphaeria miniovina]KAK0712428.1 kinase-like protein [Lasiosphaeria miniovina]